MSSTSSGTGETQPSTCVQRKRRSQGQVVYQTTHGEEGAHHRHGQEELHVCRGRTFNSRAGVAQITELREDDDKDNVESSPGSRTGFLEEAELTNVSELGHTTRNQRPRPRGHQSQTDSRKDILHDGPEWSLANLHPDSRQSSSSARNPTGSDRTVSTSPGLDTVTHRRNQRISKISRQPRCSTS